MRFRRSLVSRDTIPPQFKRRHVECTYLYTYKCLLLFYQSQVFKYIYIYTHIFMYVYSRFTKVSFTPIITAEQEMLRYAK